MSYTLETRHSSAASDIDAAVSHADNEAHTAPHAVALPAPSKSIAEVLDTVAAAVAEDPHAARTAYQVDNHLAGVTEVHVRAGHHRFVVDEPTDLGGTDLASNPIEYALASLGACQAITYRFWSEKLGIAFERLCIEVDGSIDFRGLLGLSDEVRPGFEKVHVTVRISGPAAPEDYARLQEAVESHCPMLDVFRNRVLATTDRHVS